MRAFIETDLDLSQGFMKDGLETDDGRSFSTLSELSLVGLLQSGPTYIDIGIFKTFLNHFHDEIENLDEVEMSSEELCDFFIR